MNLLGAVSGIGIDATLDLPEIFNGTAAFIEPSIHGVLPSLLPFDSTNFMAPRHHSMQEMTNMLGMMMTLLTPTHEKT